MFIWIIDKLISIFHAHLYESWMDSIWRLYIKITIDGCFPETQANRKAHRQTDTRQSRPLIYNCTLHLYGDSSRQSHQRNRPRREEQSPLSYIHTSEESSLSDSCSSRAGREPRAVPVQTGTRAAVVPFRNTRSQTWRTASR